MARRKLRCRRLCPRLCICIVFVPMFFLTGVGALSVRAAGRSGGVCDARELCPFPNAVPTLVMWFYRNCSLSRQKHDGAARTSAHWIAAFHRASNDRFETGFDRFREVISGCCAACWSIAACSLIVLSGILRGVAVCWCRSSGRTFSRAWMPASFACMFARAAARASKKRRELVDQIEAAIRQEIPREELDGILDNIGIPNSGIAPSYSNNGMIGTGDADILVSLNEGHRPTRRIRPPAAPDAEPAISREPVLFSAGGHRQPDFELRHSRAVQRPDHRPQPAKNREIAAQISPTRFGRSPARWMCACNSRTICRS